MNPPVERYGVRLHRPPVVQLTHQGLESAGTVSGRGPFNVKGGCPDVEVLDVCIFWGPASLRMPGPTRLTAAPQQRIWPREPFQTDTNPRKSQQRAVDGDEDFAVALSPWITGVSRTPSPSGSTRIGTRSRSSSTRTHNLAPSGDLKPAARRPNEGGELDVGTLRRGTSQPRRRTWAGSTSSTTADGSCGPCCGSPVAELSAGRATCPSGRRRSAHERPAGRRSERQPTNSAQRRHTRKARPAARANMARVERLGRSGDPARAAGGGLSTR